MLAVCCFVGLFAQVWMDRNKEVFLKINSANQAEQDFPVWIDVTKSWADYDENQNSCYGAQYDGFIKNNTVASYPLLYMGLFLTFIAIIVLAWKITFAVRTRKMVQRRINDEKIILQTMMTLANFIDAMNSDRCYRKRLDMETIKNELKDNAGKQFDPDVVKYMLRIIDDEDFE